MKSSACATLQTVRYYNSSGHSCTGVIVIYARKEECFRGGPCPDVNLAVIVRIVTNLNLKKKKLSLVKREY